MAHGPVGRLGAAAVLVLVGLSVVSIVAVDRSQDQSAKVAALQQVRAEMFALSRLELQVAADGPSARARTQVTEHRASLRDGLSQMQSDEPSPAIQRVAELAVPYVIAYDKAIRLLLTGKTGAAEQVLQDRVDPAFKKLEVAADDAAHEATAAAADADRLAEVLALILLPACAFVAGLLMWLVGRRRRSAGPAGRQETARRLEVMLRGSSDLVLVTDNNGSVTYASPASEKLLGLRAPTVLGKKLGDLVAPNDRKRVEACIRQVSQEKDSHASLEYQGVHTDGSPRVLESRVHNLGRRSRMNGLVWNVRDVTDRRHLEEQLSHRAFHDPLTDLPNRRLMEDRLERALGRSSRVRALVAVVLVRIDGFKDARDSLGAVGADELVQQVAVRLGDALRPGDLLARPAPDQFAVVFEAVPNVQRALIMARAACGLLEAPFEAGGRQLEVIISAGVATSLTWTPEDGPEGLIRDADVAMHAAAERRTNSIVVFEETMRGRAQDRLDLTFDLREAVLESQIRVHYQPLMHLATGTVEGFEALARWQHPTRGLISPVDFIPLAEDSGAILEIGRHVLFKACQQAAQWNGRGAPGLRISVNVSPRQFTDGDILEDVQAALTESGLAPQQLILEITESALMEDVAAVRTRLQRLRATGVRVAMDDFGTGYSSLGNLRNLPLDILKIDKSFIDDMSGAGPALIAGVVSMGNQLGLNTVAEGIEELAQLEMVQAAGCTYGQGFLFARPLDVAGATAFLLEHQLMAEAGVG